MNNENSLRAWRMVNGDDALLLDHPLNENSVVFEVGGFLGSWADAIRCLYNPYIYIFEPVPKHVEILKTRFNFNPKVHILGHALSKFNGTREIEYLEDSSSLDSIGNLKIQVRDIWEVTQELLGKDTYVDLININTEGDEYRLLPRLINTGMISIFNFIQVQFHNNLPHAHIWRNDIREQLSKTHEEVWCFPFVWECWRRKQ